MMLRTNPANEMPGYGCEERQAPIWIMLPTKTSRAAMKRLRRKGIGTEPVALLLLSVP